MERAPSALASSFSRNGQFNGVEFSRSNGSEAMRRRLSPREDGYF